MPADCRSECYRRSLAEAPPQGDHQQNRDHAADRAAIHEIEENALRLVFERVTVRCGVNRHADCLPEPQRPFGWALRPPYEAAEETARDEDDCHHDDTSGHSHASSRPTPEVLERLERRR